MYCTCLTCVTLCCYRNIKSRAAAVSAPRCSRPAKCICYSCFFCVCLPRGNCRLLRQSRGMDEKAGEGRTKADETKPRLQLTAVFLVPAVAIAAAAVSPMSHSPSGKRLFSQAELKIKKKNGTNPFYSFKEENTAGFTGTRRCTPYCLNLGESKVWILLIPSQSSIDPGATYAAPSSLPLHRKMQTSFSPRERTADKKIPLYQPGVS